MEGINHNDHHENELDSVDIVTVSGKLTPQEQAEVECLSKINYGRWAQKLAHSR